MKNKFALLALTMLSLNASATALSTDSLKGFYAGVGGAETYIHFHNKFSFNPDVVEDTNFYDRSTNFDTTNFNPEVVLGYAKVFNRYYLGLEIGINFTDFQRTDMNSDYTARYTLDTTYDVIAKAGYQIKTATTLYGLAGATRTSFNETIAFASGGQLGELNLAAFSQNKNVWGAIVGIGLEQAVSEHCHLALEYNHTFYNDINFPLQHAIFKFLGNVGNSQLDLNENTVMLKAIYYL